MKLFQPPDLDPREVSSSLLAYLGDGVVELYFRTKYLSKMKTTVVSEMVRRAVSREGQARLLDSVLPLLDEEEMDVVKRAMNSKVASRHGNDPLYRKSTGLEALVGYLYLKGRYDRIEEILGGG